MTNICKYSTISIKSYCITVMNLEGHVSYNNAVAGPKCFFKPELWSVYFFWGEIWAGHALDRFHVDSQYHCKHSFTI